MSPIVVFGSLMAKLRDIRKDRDTATLCTGSTRTSQFALLELAVEPFVDGPVFFEQVLPQ